MPEAHKNTPAGHVGMPYHGIEAFISLSVRRNVYSRGRISYAKMSFGYIRRCKFKYIFILFFILFELTLQPKQ